MNDAVLPTGNAARAIWESTESVELGRACMCTASHETPRKRLIAIVPRTASVRAAFADWGRLNAFTPLAIASTPVNADAPDENARSRTRTPTAPAPAASGFGATACGHVPTVQRAIPVPIAM